MAYQNKTIDINGFSKLVYVGRKKDDDGHIIPYTSVSGAVIQEEEVTLTDGSTETMTSKVKLPNGQEVAAYPIITLLEAPMLAQPFFTSNPAYQFRTGVFLHIDQYESYTAREISGNNNPDRTYQFRVTADGIGITDMTKGQEYFFDKETLAALGIISQVASWNYKAKIQSWFDLDYRVPTGVVTTNQFLTDIGKIPFTTGMLNNQAWDM